jgi:hypothetical protein
LKLGTKHPLPAAPLTFAGTAAKQKPKLDFPINDLTSADTAL